MVDRNRQAGDPTCLTEGCNKLPALGSHWCAKHRKDRGAKQMSGSKAFDECAQAAQDLADHHEAHAMLDKIMEHPKLGGAPAMKVLLGSVLAQIAKGAADE